MTQTKYYPIMTPNAELQSYASIPFPSMTYTPFFYSIQVFLFPSIPIHPSTPQRLSAPAPQNFHLLLLFAFAFFASTSFPPLQPRQHRHMFQAKRYTDFSPPETPQYSDTTSSGHHISAPPSISTFADAPSVRCRPRRLICSSQRLLVCRF